ncbi:MAG: hypothetical protein HXY36_02790 [Chloroflexi bacterium]|nr:hypothetical protein [Chloroflexota bacterium]
MRKSILIAITVVLVVALGAAAAVVGSEGNPSSKATCQVGYVEILNSGDMGWTPILSNVIKMPNQKDLFIDVSLECGLYTKTLVKSKGLVPDTSTAMALIKVRVWVDDDLAYPGEVTFNARTQTLTAKFAGMLVDDQLTEEELELILDTMSANSFNFILDDLPQGTHTVTVEAMIDTETLAQLGVAEAWATIGNGSVTVEEVRMIKGEDILLE